MKMIVINQDRILRVAPAFRVEVQAEHQIRMQFRVHQHGTPPDFAVAVKQNLALPPNGVLLFRVVRVQKFRARLGHPVFHQDLTGQLLEIVRTQRRDRLGAVPHEGNFGTQFSQAGRDHARYSQGHISFGDGKTLTHLKPSFLHLRPGASQVPRVERDAQPGQRPTRRRGAQFFGRMPQSGHVRP